jgi:hypothetical protein
VALEAAAEAVAEDAVALEAEAVEEDVEEAAAEVVEEEEEEVEIQLPLFHIDILEYSSPEES